MQVQLLNAGVLTVPEVRAVRGLPPLESIPATPEEVAMQVQLLNAGVLTVAEVRTARGLPPLESIAAGVEEAR